MTDTQASFESLVVRYSIAIGLLYTIFFHLWVATGVDALGLVPPAALFGYYLAAGGVVSVWRCESCDAVAPSLQCSQCESAKAVERPFLERAALYLVVAPAGAIVVEFLTMLFVEAAFHLLGDLSVVARYRAEWYGTVGLFGPIGLFLSTLTAPVAYLLSVAVGASWAVVASLSPSGQ